MRTRSEADESEDQESTIHRPRSSSRSTDGGFTLIEVMVVVLILGILLAVSTPTLFGARQRAWDVAARSSLRTTMNSAVLLSEFRSDFTFASASSLASAEPSLSYVAGTTPSTGPKMLSIDATSSGRFVAVARSQSGTCFAVVVGPGGQAFTTPGTCIAAEVTASAPGLPSTYSGTKVHEGAAGAVTAGMCLEVVNGFVQQQPCNGTQPRIRIYTRPDGYSTVSSTDGKCFGTVSPTMAAEVADEPCVESIDQLWRLIPGVGGTVQFKNAETGWCLDVYGASASAGARLIQWGYGTSPNGTCKPTDSPNNQLFSLN